MSEGFIRIIVGFVALLVGWAIGFFDSKMRADKKIAQAEQKAEIVVNQARGEAERAALAAQAARAAAESKPSLPGSSLLRLWLDANANPQLDLDNQRVEVSPLADLNRKRLLALLNIMRPWIEGKSAAPSPAPAPSASAQHPMPRPLTPPAPPPAPVPVVAPAKAEKPAAPLSIVGQIDEILQARLAFSPLTNRGVRLTESPEGSVIVWVGLQKFAGVGEVTDTEVKAVIQAAISEWEKKYTPGL